MASPVARARARRAAAAIALTALASALATVRIWYYGRAVALPARAMGLEGGVTPRGGVSAAPCPATAEMSGRSYVFVLGLHSCGTSLLHAALTSAPGASALEARGDAAPMGEGEYLQTVLPRGGALAARAGERRAWAFPLNREAFISERNLTLATAANCARLRHEWHARWNVKGGADGTAVLVEKSPADTTRARYLAWAFPGARFALLLRHPLLKCRKWAGGADLDKCLEAFNRGYSAAADDMHFLTQRQMADEGGERERWAAVFYEELVSEPEDTLAALATDLALPAAMRERRAWDTIVRTGTTRMDLVKADTFAEPNATANSKAGKAAMAMPAFGYRASGARTGEVRVDGRQPLPPNDAVDALASRLGAARLAQHEARLARFGYSLAPPFVRRDCSRERRRALDCPPG